MALFCYFREIQLHGIKNIPRNQAVMFLANHQNALLDPLVIAAFTPFRSYFLTRSDIFINPLVNQFFKFLRMLPIYRIRDGRDTLSKNTAIFEQCTQLLQTGKTILLFPEANHNIMRRVRPLSKGFTRILFTTLEKAPELDVLLVPVGINYEKADRFPDRVAFYFSEPITARDYYSENDLATSVVRTKDVVSEALKRSTTHIEDLSEYDAIHNYLDIQAVNYLDPGETNKAIEKYNGKSLEKKQKTKPVVERILNFVFLTINAPLIFIWRWFLKPQIQEAEFISTFRFAYVSVLQPLFYLTLWALCSVYLGLFWATLIVILHFLFNLTYVKFANARL
ncbi:lysophospholipid acyltransferase family protein [Muriicola sp. SD30]|uniref:lysophospholipid acyltransferase family protein n=1 Tax=Muriicola sp. SD30 TaxID=3240936 RepID=UPI00350EBEA5